jgi:arylsulfatase
MYHHGWAWAGDTPFKSTKLIAAHFGGTRTPCVIHWPQGIKADRRPRPQFHHVIDIVPTLYEVAGITSPRTVDGVEQMALDGDSMVYSFNDPTTPEQKRPQFFDIMGSRGIYRDGWFAAAFGPKKPWSTDISGLLNWDPDEDVWELYDLSKDFSQAHDLADKLPKKLQAMKAAFTVEAAKNLAFPIGGGLYVPGYHPEEMRVTPLTEWNFFEGQTRIGETLAPRFISGFSSLATIQATVPENAEGVLFCLGGISAGFSVFMDQGYLHAEYNAMTLNRYKVKSDKPLPTGEVTIEIEAKFDSRQRRSGGTITFRVDGEQVGQGRFEDSVPVIFTASETFDVGMDLGSPVSLDYYDRTPFKFNGKIEKTHIKYI